MYRKQWFYFFLAFSYFLLWAMPSHATTILNSNGGQCAFSGANGGLKVYVGQNSQFQVERCSANGATSNTRQYYNTANTPPSTALFNSIYLRVGTTIIGAANSAGVSGQTNWTTVSESGGSTLGDGTATTVYRAVVGGLTYTVTQTTTYVFPNDFYSVRLDVAIPAGNTANVKLYSWTDLMLDGDDNGTCSRDATFPEFIIADNTAKTLYAGYRQRNIANHWNRYWCGLYNEPTSGLGTSSYIRSASGDLPNTLAAGNLDVGAAVQWNIGTVANTTFTAQYDFVFAVNAPTLTKRYGPNDGDNNHSMPTGNTTTLTFTITNRPGDPAQGSINFTETLPTNVRLSGTPTASQCGGTVSTGSSGGRDTITLTNGALLGGVASCDVVVNVTSAIPAVYADPATNISATNNLVNLANATLTVTATTYNCPNGTTATGSGYASTGTGAYKNLLYWLDWSCGAATSFQIGDTINKTWVTPTGATITAQVNNITGGVIANYTTGSWAGDVLDNLYSNLNPIGLRNVNGGTTPAFNITWSATMNGVSIPLNLVFADAEDLDGSEFEQMTTNGTSWQLLESTGSIQAIFSNANKTVRYQDPANAGGGTVLALTENVTSTSTSFNGSGLTAVAFAVAIGMDYGDAPSSYGTSGSKQDMTASGGGQPTTLTDANTITKATIAYNSNQWLGSVKGDIEQVSQAGATATGDDVLGVDDEDGINTASVSLNTRSSRLSVNVVANNTGASSANLVGWLDVNQNGVFEASEGALATVPAGSSNKTVTLTWENFSGLTAGTTYARFQISADTNLSKSTPILGATNGEVEDYAFTIKQGVLIVGRVFVDNSGTTGLAANAYNGVQNTGEVGIPNSAVALTNCSGTTLLNAQTNALGDYEFATITDNLYSPNFCVEQTNVNGYSSVSGTAGYSRVADRITISNTGAANYSGLNFGDARLGLSLTSDGQQTTVAGGVVNYPHILTSESVLTPTLSAIASNQPATQTWTSVVYLDSNCNGQIDSGEAPVTSLGVLLPNQQICVVQRVTAPFDASNGAQHVANLSASYVATVQDSTVLSGNSQTRTDTTLVGTGALNMTKLVRVVAACPSGDNTESGFGIQNTAKNGQFLEYQIRYQNIGARNLSQVVIKDATPSNTLFKSAACQSTPAGNSCAVELVPPVNGQDVLRFKVTGPVAPNAQGTVRFCVQVPALAAGPL